jgi:hypothetical protein
MIELQFFEIQRIRNNYQNMNLYVLLSDLTIIYME